MPLDARDLRLEDYVARVVLISNHALGPPVNI